MCVTDLPRVKLPPGNFHGYVKKNKRIAHDSSRPKSYGLSKPQSGSTNHVAAIANYRRSHAVFALGSKSFPPLDNMAGFRDTEVLFPPMVKYSIIYKSLEPILWTGKYSTQARLGWRATSRRLLKYKQKSCKDWRKRNWSRRLRCLLVLNR